MKSSKPFFYVYRPSNRMGPVVKHSTVEAEQAEAEDEEDPEVALLRAVKDCLERVAAANAKAKPAPAAEAEKEAA